MTSLSGSVTGKLAGNVYSVNSGQQIVRAYQPNVSNPNTDQQVNNRTKFKLASQLSVAVAPVLAISKQGMVSARNQFVSATMGAIRFALGEATVILQELQLTKSSIVFPNLIATRGDNNSVTVSVNGRVTTFGVTKVVYAVFMESYNNQLQLINKKVVSEPGDDGRFTTEYDNMGNHQYIIYAYGIIEEANSILAKYGSYQVDDATFVASLISSRSDAASGIKTTATSCAVVSPT